MQRLEKPNLTSLFYIEHSSCSNTIRCAF